MFHDSLHFKEQLTPELAQSRLNHVSQFEQLLAVVELALDLLVSQIC